MKNSAFLFQSDRLGFRPFLRDDAQAFYEMNNDPEVLHYTGDRPFKDRFECEAFIKNYRAYDLWGYGRWSVIDLNTKRFIGFSGFKYHKADYVDLGFRLSRDNWNKGFATEAAKACLDYGFNILQFQEIIGRVAENNLASIRVLEKVGFAFWKRGECMGIEDALFYRISKNLNKEN